MVRLVGGVFLVYLGIRATPAITVAGVLCGSLGWWLVLVTVTGALRECVGERALLWATRSSGVAIAVLGVAAIVAGLQTLIG